MYCVLPCLLKQNTEQDLPVDSGAHVPQECLLLLYFGVPHALRLLLFSLKLLYFNLFSFLFLLSILAMLFLSLFAVSSCYVNCLVLAFFPFLICGFLCLLKYLFSTYYVPGTVREAFGTVNE